MNVVTQLGYFSEVFPFPKYVCLFLQPYECANILTNLSLVLRLQCKISQCFLQKVNSLKSIKCINKIKYIYVLCSLRNIRQQIYQIINYIFTNMNNKLHCVCKLAAPMNMICTHFAENSSSSSCVNKKTPPYLSQHTIWVCSATRTT